MACKQEQTDIKSKYLLMVSFYIFQQFNQSEAFISNSYIYINIELVYSRHVLTAKRKQYAKCL